MTAAPATRPVLESGPALVLAVVARLRAGGLSVSTSESIDAVSALAALDLTRRKDVKQALRSTLVKESGRAVLFERAFAAVFPVARSRASSGQSDPADPSTESDDGGPDDAVMDSLVNALRHGSDDDLDAALEASISRFAGSEEDGRSVGHHTRRTLRRMNVTSLYRRYLEGDASTDASEMDRALNTAEATAAIEQMKRRLEELISGRLREGDQSPAQLEDPQDRPLLRAGPDELAAMRSVMRPLARRLAARLGTQRRQGRGGLDMRRTIRSSMGTGGVPVSPVLRRRRPTKPDLVVLCDVSGSTAQFAPFTLTLLHAVHQEFRRVRSFVFIDGIVEITDLLANSPGVLDPNHLLARSGLIAMDGRSDYQRAFHTFLERWGNAVTPKTTVIVAGDARAHNRLPATAELGELQHRARRLYWLNPEPRSEWDTLDSYATEYEGRCTAVFEVSTIRQLIAAVAQIV